MRLRGIFRLDYEVMCIFVGYFIYSMNVLEIHLVYSYWISSALYLCWLFCNFYSGFHFTLYFLHMVFNILWRVSSTGVLHRKRRSRKLRRVWSQKGQTKNYGNKYVKIFSEDPRVEPLLFLNLLCRLHKLGCIVLFLYCSIIVVGSWKKPTTSTYHLFILFWPSSGNQEREIL